MIKVSYIVPLYNKEQYIKECIDSILMEQTEEIEIEVCIVDDGSTDGSLSIVEKYYGNESRVKLQKFIKNKGKNAACNTAYKMVTGEYVCLFGADDIVISGRTEKLLTCAKKNKKAVYGGLIAKNENLSNEFFRQFPIEQNLYSITMSNGLSGGCGLISKILCEEIFPIPENLKFEDWWISYHLVKNNDYYIIKDYVTIYRIGSQNDCGSYGGDIYSNLKKDYIRHFDYLSEFEKKFDNPIIDKAIDLRKAFLGLQTKKTIYFSPFDLYSIQILLYKILGAKFIYRIKSFIFLCMNGKK